MPEKNIPLSDFYEKAVAACNSADLLGLEGKPTAEHWAEAEEAVREIAVEPTNANKKYLKKSQSYDTPTYRATKQILDEFSIRVVENATQIRLLVTNKLILETENPDPKIRLRALENLGKITDVGLFTEKSEVTVTHRSSEDLVSSLRAKIQKLRAAQDEDAVDGEIISINGVKIDVDKEITGE